MKPIYQPLLIPNWSNNPVSYKMAAFRSFYKRVLTYCWEEEDLTQELAYVEKVGMQHEYSKTFFRQIWNKVKGNALNCQQG